MKNSLFPKIRPKYMFWTTVLFLTVTVISYFFFISEASDPILNIAMLYTLGVFITTRYTDGYFYGFLFTIGSVIAVNYFFTYPFWNLNFGIKGYHVTFLGMITIGIVTSALSTHLKKQERELREQEKSLAEQEKKLMEAQKEKMRANLLRAVSHDLRTPLTGIIGNSLSYLDMGDKFTKEENRQLIENINTDAVWLLNMVENLLSVTRIDNETAKVNKSLEALEEVVSSAVIYFKKRFPEAKVKIIMPEAVIMAMMDGTLIQQVIINILQNAQVYSKSSKPLELKVEDLGASAKISIRDYGVGIDEDRLENIFDGVGNRSQTSDTDGYKGMGIGLSICKTIVLAHKGEIMAKNYEDGAEFSFTLPKETEE